jgi:ppGpp synthetase/RelA/SpoT-type nucleotidyltranferase
MAQVLQQVLEKAARQFAPLAILQTRPKAIPSFVEKAIRKKKVGRYDEPLERMTDLCGGRVITQTLAEVRAVSDFIEKHFIVDEKNSVDVSERLKPSEFGYRSIHYIVQFKRGVFPTKEIPVEIPEELYPDASTPMKAEIQVRTVTEHAWAGFVHDRVYKSAFTIPPKWERELAVLAGMLEQTDQSFTRIQAGLRTYKASYGAYLNEEQLKDEISILESVLTCDPENPDLTYRIGKLAMELGAGLIFCISFWWPISLKDGRRI